jgi:hypothetical protein
MNERIRELAEQAGHRYIPSSNNGPLRVEYLTPELEKFAQLIVRECAGIYDKIDNGNLHMGTDNYLEALHKTFRS